MSETSREPTIEGLAKAVHIDATPDGGYALRILRYFRERCNETWRYEGPSDNLKKMHQVMNEAQIGRAAELDKAIHLLEAAR